MPVASGGDVYYNVRRLDTENFPAANWKEMQAGLTVDWKPRNEAQKSKILWFCLWKHTVENIASSSWERSPRMAHRMFSDCAIASGETIDIHCGGSDLLFRTTKTGAQSEAATGKSLAGIGCTNAFVTVNGKKKMSKSLLYYNSRFVGWGIGRVILTPAPLGGRMNLTPPAPPPC